MQIAFNDTLDKISKECNVDIEMLSPGIVKKNLKYAIASGDERWRIPLATDLQAIRNGRKHVPGFSKEEIHCMLQSVCVS